MVGTPFAAHIFLSLLNQNSYCIFQRKTKSRAHRNYTISGRCTAVRVSVISMRPAIRWRFFILRRLAAGAPLCSVQQVLILYLHFNKTNVLLPIASNIFYIYFTVGVSAPAVLFSLWLYEAISNAETNDNLAG